MKFPAWRQSLVRSLHVQRSRPESKFFQVASVSPTGQINNRTMVFRGFVEDSLDLLAITDSRSDKIQDWQTKAEAEICWYFVKTREQYRIRVNVITYQQADNHIRNNIYTNLSKNAKAQFLWPTPKVPIDNDVLDGNSTSVDEENKDVFQTPPSNFVVVRFVPSYVDYLHLCEPPQNRELHELIDNKWLVTKVTA